MNVTRIYPDEVLLRASDVAKQLNISRALAYRLIQTGEIPVVRINHAVRVKPSDLREFIRKCQQGLIRKQ